MKTYSSTEIRKNFSEAYHSVKHSGEPILIKHHNDASVIMMRVEDVYPEITNSEMYESAQQSGAFTSDNNPTYE